MAIKSLKTGNFSRSLLIGNTAYQPNTYPNISNLYARYDASTSGNVSLSGTSVTQWTDISGNSRNMTASGSESPTYVTAGKNSLNTISFDGTDDKLQTSSFSFTNPATLFFVIKMNSFQSYKAIFDGINNNTANIVANNDSSVNKFAFYSSGWETVQLTSVNSGTWYRMTWVFDGAGSLAYTNDNSPVTWTDGNISDIGGFRLGEGDGGGEHSPMELGEFIVYNRALNSTERGQVNSYLSTRWAI